MYYFPVKNGVVTREYGEVNTNKYRDYNGFHSGIDIAPRGDKRIYSPIDSVVVAVGYNEEWWGKYFILHNVREDVYFGFAHCATIAVEVGDHVKMGQPIAVCGKTGNATGVHLHLNMSEEGQTIHEPHGMVESDWRTRNPLPFLSPDVQSSYNYDRVLKEAEHTIQVPATPHPNPNKRLVDKIDESRLPLRLKDQTDIENEGGSGNVINEILQKVGIPTGLLTLISDNYDYLHLGESTVIILVAVVLLVSVVGIDGVKRMLPFKWSRNRISGRYG